jgi:RNA recognition motif-containing protein
LKTLFVGNVPFSCNEHEIANLFGEAGTVHSVKFILHKETGRPRGFCFVEMDDSGADIALATLNGSSFGGRTLKVEQSKIARPRN